MPKISRWSLKYDACVDCGLTQWKHSSHGLCKRCHKRAYRKTPQGRAERKRYFSKWYKTEHGKNIVYEHKLKDKYGISLEEKEEMLKNQEGKCAICGKSPYKNIRDWHVDHNHDTGKVRSLLCGLCNKGLGQFLDNPTLLLAASQYLQKFI